MCINSRSLCAVGVGRGAGDDVAGFGRRQVVAHRTDAAGTRRDLGHFVEHPPFAELLEATELLDVEEGILHLALIIQMYRNLGVPFDSGHRRNRNFLCHRLPPKAPTLTIHPILQDVAFQLGRTSRQQLGQNKPDGVG